MKICQEFILRNAPTVKKECGPGTRFWSDLKLWHKSDITKTVTVTQIKAQFLKRFYLFIAFGLRKKL